MPNYLYQHPTTKKIVEVFQHMNDVHEYFEDKIKFQRIFTKPTASVDTKLDIYSAKDFAKVTNKSGGTIGELWDRSAELSAARADKEGIDPVKNTFYRNYEKQHKTKHPEEKKEVSKKKLDEAGISVSWEG